MGRTHRPAALAALALAMAVPAAAQAATAPEPARAAAKRLGLKRIGTFSQPVHVAAAPRDRRRVYVVELAGRIRVVQDGRRRRRPFLDIRSLVTSGGEQGLHSVAFAPDFKRSRRFYVHYTDRDAQQRVVEYRARNRRRADPGSARLVLRMADSEPNHNGGLLAFGPDRLLYLGTGDGGGAGDRHGARGNAQDLSSLLGKLLRIDPRRRGSRPYTVPSGNPFTGRAGARPEVYAYGLRNPWRYSFDRRTGDLAIGDVGQSAVEEVSFRRRGRGAGANFGWRVWEGRSPFAAGESAPGHVAPVITLDHADGYCSITGGVVARDRRLPVTGRYLFADVCDGRILSAKLGSSSSPAVRATGLRVSSPVSFGEDARGRVHVVSLGGGVFRLRAR